MLKKAWNTISTGSTVWGLLPSAWQTGIVAGLSAVTAYFGFAAGNIAFAIFMTVGVFAFGMASIFFMLRLAEMSRVFQRISLQAIGITEASLKPDHSGVRHLNLTGHLRNDSHRLVFYRLRRASAMIARQTGEGSIERNVIILQVGGAQGINFSTIENIPLPPGGGDAPKGKLELEVEYGPAKDDLKYLFHYVGELQLGAVIDNENKNAHLRLNAVVKELEHLMA